MSDHNYMNALIRCLLSQMYMERMLFAGSAKAGRQGSIQPPHFRAKCTILLLRNLKHFSLRFNGCSVGPTLLICA